MRLEGCGDRANLQAVVSNEVDHHPVAPNRIVSSTVMQWNFATEDDPKVSLYTEHEAFAQRTTIAARRAGREQGGLYGRGR